MIANQGLLGMHCPVATLVGWLGWCGLETRGSLMGRLVRVPGLCFQGGEV